MMRYEIELTTVTSGYDRKTCWVHARAGVIPPATAVLTTQKLRLTGSDIFYALHSTRSDDQGRTWSPLVKQDTLDRRLVGDNIEAAPCDFTPAWHAATGKLLGTGHTALYTDDELLERPYPRQGFYTVYDPETDRWSPWKTLAMPGEDRFFNAGAGCTQRVDLPGGDILLPIYYLGRDSSDGDPSSMYRTTVVRCGFDGANLSYLEHGDELSAPHPRGFCEPSLIVFAGRFYLTLRNDISGYVTNGDDGLHFAPPKPWTFDDGEELGSYNTQQHWLAHSDALFLIYTHRGANNDHIFRHRAPLFMAQVDPDRLCVIRETERIVIPERGAALGNFGTVNVSKDESWIVVSEWMQTNPPDWSDCTVCERYGSNNSIFVSRIRWEKLNRLVNW